VYTLRDDRTVEYGYARDNLVPGAGRLLLDVGTPLGFPTIDLAVQRGYRVVATDLRGVDAVQGNITFKAGDFLEIEFEQQFDRILNISSVEHFGLAGRYGIAKGQPMADLLAMAKLRTLMKPGAMMLLTVPVGVDAVAYPYHRVYGWERLPRLLAGYNIISQEFWAKLGGVDKYISVSEATALATISEMRAKTESAADHYYAIGGFTLEATR